MAKNSFFGMVKELFGKNEVVDGVVDVIEDLTGGGKASSAAKKTGVHKSSTVKEKATAAKKKAKSTVKKSGSTTSKATHKKKTK